MKTNLLRNWILGLGGLIIAASCNPETEDQMNGNATLNVSMVDAPADYDEVWIEVLGVEVLTGDDNEENESAWISIGNEAEDDHVNLLSLVGGNSAFIGSKEIPAGEITQIRLLLGEDNFLVKDGEEIHLTTPSAQQSGLKLQVHEELLAGIQYNLVIDFDAAQSIVKAGNSGKYILKPVLRVVAEESATIEGIVLPVEAEPTIYGIINEDTVSTFTDENGAFALRGLMGGEYTIIFDPMDTTYLADTLYNVPTIEGEITVLDPVQLEEAPVEEEPTEEETTEEEEGTTEG
ncbi:DUF4382 domain-containing protein [Echinicola jeungdonensis]|uniref:DUF4382 domain-containing protein n=1 Tax=Echinicola jeungdonensis TaxID=709343 RepID=A0ABV5J1T4_9BACT|nr:DUF4382 domain-containing protein [Echinicola jeungdonensis]MDN3668939.1 DUF4382 domain-containing protein [Echinicola jeungdonensis]